MNHYLITAVLIGALVAGCTPSAEPGPNKTQAEVATTTASGKPDDACPLCRTWNATRLTINGKVDRKMDPTDLVTLTFRSDGSFQLKDATEGDTEELEGTWKMGPDSVLALSTKDGEPFTDFKVMRLHDGTLVMKVLERAEEAEVLMYYKAAN